MSDLRIVQTTTAPTPRGHYSQAIVHGGLVYVAGQLPLDPATSEVVGGTDPHAQAVATLRNVQAVLEAAGSAIDRVVSLTIYVTQEDLWAAVNAAVAEVFGDHRPSRAIIPISPLRGGALLEIQAIGALKG